MHGPAIATSTKGPRAAATYRGHVRNTWKAARRLPEWRDQAAAIANRKAKLPERRAQAVASAMLGFYNGEKRTRPVNRIICDLERQIRVAS